MPLKGTLLIMGAAAGRKNGPPIPSEVDTVPKPAAPYAGWNHGPDFFANETNIDVSTVPLPAADCPNPAP